MNTLDVLNQVRELLRMKGRITYRVLKRQFDLDDDYLEDIKAELIEAERVALDEAGKVLVWVGNGASVAGPSSTPQLTESQTPVSYTPQHLAERIRAEQAAMESRGAVNGELAYHYTQSENGEKAVAYLGLAGHQAVQKSAREEAVQLLLTALGTLRRLPETAERAQQELTLHLSLGSAFIATKGWAAEEVERVYTQALTLSQRDGTITQRLPVLWALVSFYQVRGEFQTAQPFEEQLLQLVQNSHDPACLVPAHRLYGAGLHFRGVLGSALTPLNQGIALYDREQHRSLAFVYGQDLGVSCLGSAVWTLWHLGYPDQARQRLREALTLAQELAQPISLALALVYATGLHLCCREGQAAQEQAEALLNLSDEFGFEIGYLYRREAFGIS